MITKINVKNFKSHKNTDLELSNLNLLCGSNGVGKSSIIQALLLLRQSHLKNRLHEVIDLNKPLCEIGTFNDALFQYADSENISFRLQIDGQNCFWSGTNLSNGTNGSFNTFLELIEKVGEYKDSALFSKNFQYISAARLAPQESYPKDDYEVQRNQQISIDKGKGELTAHYLDFFKNKKVPFENLINVNSKYQELIYQTSAWEREISSGVNVKVVETGKGFELKYNFEVKNHSPTDDFNAENVGFGITYTLPIIVSLLSAEKGSLIIIENPEAHIHPKGQAKLAELIALASSNGVQIIVETHSDHIFNGILVAVKKRMISNKLVKVYNFSRDENEHVTNSTEIIIDKDGKIDTQPAGFFDQIDNDLKIIMGF